MLKKEKTQSLENSKKERYYDVGNETIEKKSLDDLKKEYGDYIKFLEDVPGNDEDPNLEWVLIKGEYVIYVGQINKEGKREGKGLLINPSNVFSGEFKMIYQMEKVILIMQIKKNYIIINMLMV